MAEETSNLKRKERGSDSSISDNELRSPEEKRSRDKPLKDDLASSSGDIISEHLEMTHVDLGKKN